MKVQGVAREYCELRGLLDRRLDLWDGNLEVECRTRSVHEIGR